MAECSGFSCVEESEENRSEAVLAKMLPIIYRTRDGPTHNKARTSSSQEQPLFAVAMEMKLDKERNSTVGFKCSQSVILCKMLRHRVVLFLFFFVFFVYVHIISPNRRTSVHLVFKMPR